MCFTRDSITSDQNDIFIDFSLLDQLLSTDSIDDSEDPYKPTPLPNLPMKSTPVFIQTDMAQKKQRTQPVPDIVPSHMTKASTSASTTTVIVPSILPQNYAPFEHDVICGKGKEAFYHKGNESFRDLLDTRLESYLNAKKRIEKSIIVTEIIHSIRTKNGGRFVRRQKDGRWHEVGDDAARHKVLQYFREVAISNTTKPTKLLKRKLDWSAKRAVSTSALECSSDLSHSIAPSPDKISSDAPDSTLSTPLFKRTKSC